MEKITEEKGLTKIDNGIFAKIRRFLVSIFNKKHVQNNETINQEEKENIENEDNENEKNEPKEFRVIIKENKFVIESEFLNKLNEPDEENKKHDLDYEEKEEIEQKLMNYYATIKKSL